jgi:predicted dehydrogenase
MAAALAIGVIGAGQVAQGHVAAYRANPSTRVAVSIDPALERAQALAQTCNAAVAASYEEVLAHGGLDAVSVCVPHDLHFPVVAEAATAAGVHMLMEKPIANTLDEADGIIERVERSGIRLMIGFVHRFRTEVRAGITPTATGMSRTAWLR